MKIDDVRLGAQLLDSGDVSLICVSPNGFRFIIGRLSLDLDFPQSKETRLNRRQLRIVAERMCNVFNADQMYGPLEKEKDA